MIYNLIKKSVLTLSLLCGFTLLAISQVPEEIITEASTPVEEQFLDGIVERNDMHESRVLAYPPYREADVPWERTIWRVLDVREKINAPFINPLRPFAEIIIEGAENGDLTAFTQDDFLEPMDPEEINRLLFRIDTNVVIDPETYEEEIVVTQSSIDAMNIQRFRIKEVWYFNNKYSRMGVRVLGISPLLDVLDEDTGEFRYELPLFWVYYPQARKLLARESVFVSGNDAAPMTWLDLWEMRRFSSYVFKASNVYDERLEAFHETRIEQLIESQRIEDDLFNFEMDFWSY
jgi:gliding motility associated protien GldN